MDVSISLTTLEGLFNSNDKSILAGFPSDLSVNYFLDKELYFKFAESKLDKPGCKDTCSHFIFRFSTEHFLKFVNFDNLCLDSTKVVGDMRYGFVNFEGIIYTLYLLEKSEKEDGRGYILDHTFNGLTREYLNERIFVVRNNKIVGHLTKFEHKGFYLIDNLNQISHKHKIFITIKLFEKLNLYNNKYYSKFGQFDLDLNSTYVLHDQIDFDITKFECKDVVFLNKQIVNSDETEKNQMEFVYRSCKAKEILQVLFMVFGIEWKCNDFTLENLKEKEFTKKPKNYKFSEKEELNEKFYELLDQLISDYNFCNETTISEKYIFSLINTLHSIYQTLDNNKVEVEVEVERTVCVKSVGLKVNPETGISTSQEEYSKIPKNNNQSNIESNLLTEVSNKQINLPINASECLEEKLSKQSFTINGHPLTLDKIQELVNQSEELFEKGETKYNEGFFIESKSNYEDCVNIRRQYLGGKKETAIALTSLGGVHMKLGNYKEALEIYYEAAEIFEKSLGAKHILLASVLHNIGLIFDFKGNFDEALKYYNQALEIKVEVLGDNNSSTASTYYNIGGIWELKGNFSEALRIYRKTIEIYDLVLTEVNIDSATVYNNIGLVFDKLNSSEESIENYEKCLEICSKLFNYSHPLIATCHNNLGLVYFKSNKFEEAILNFEKSIEIREQVSESGVRNLDLASSYNNLAGIYYKTQNYSYALKTYEKCLTLNIEMLGELTPETATAYNNIGLVQIKLKLFEQALTSFNQAYKIRHLLFGADDKETLNAEINIAGVYFKLKDNDKSLFCYLKILSALPENSIELVTLYTNIGHCYNNLSDLENSLKYYLKSLELSIILHGEKSYYTADAYSNLSNYYENINDTEKAKEYLMKSVVIKENLNYLDE